MSTFFLNKFFLNILAAYIVNLNYDWICSSPIWNVGIFSSSYVVQHCLKISDIYSTLYVKKVTTHNTFSTQVHLKIDVCIFIWKGEISWFQMCVLFSTFNKILKQQSTYQSRFACILWWYLKSTDMPSWINIHLHSANVASYSDSSSE